MPDWVDSRPSAPPATADDRRRTPGPCLKCRTGRGCRGICAPLATPVTVSPAFRTTVPAANSSTAVGGRSVPTDVQLWMITSLTAGHSRRHGTSHLYPFSRRNCAHVSAHPDGLDGPRAGSRCSPRRNRARSARLVFVRIRVCRESRRMACGRTAHLHERSSPFRPRNAVIRCSSRCRLPDCLSPSGAFEHASPAHP